MAQNYFRSLPSVALFRVRMTLLKIQNGQGMALRFSVVPCPIVKHPWHAAANDLEVLELSILRHAQSSLQHHQSFGSMSQIA